MARTEASENDTTDPLDLAVIGAGIYGIQAVRTYLHLHPKHRVLVFEASSSIGGVWSSERIYDAFWTQTPLKILEFSDMPLEGVPEFDIKHGFFPARHVSKYLESYIGTRHYGGESLEARIRLQSRVQAVIKQETGWKLVVETSGDAATNTQQTYTAQKVIDATGLTSKPNIPNIPNQHIFQGTSLHHLSFAKQEKTILSETGPRNIAVLGGAKSAADVAYACAKAGREVTWVIRRSGSGPAAFVAAKGAGPYQNSNESFYTRLISHFLVSFFFDESKTWLGRFLYHTTMGRYLLAWLWTGIDRRAHALADFDRRDNKGNEFRNLKPDTPIFWQNDSTGVCLHDDFFDTIAEGVKVIRMDVKMFTASGLELEDGTVVKADTVVYCTGWTTSHPRYETANDGRDLAFSLGLSVPTPNDKDPQEPLIDWNTMEDTYTEELLSRFPMLRTAPQVHHADRDRVPSLRLYKGILPVSERSIAFVGQMMLGNNFRAAEVQALYAVAALDGTLSLPSKEEMQMTIAKTLCWSRWRYMSKGLRGNWIYWDLMPYTDNLLDELGLCSHRHKSWWKDLLWPGFASDLRNLLGEYKIKSEDANVKEPSSPDPWRHRVFFDLSRDSAGTDWADNTKSQVS